MRNLKEDINHTRDVLLQERARQKKEEVLAEQIKQIHVLYNITTSDKYPTRFPQGREIIDGFGFPYVIFPCVEQPEQSVDVDISLGVPDRLNPHEYGQAWVRIETYPAQHTPEDEPIVMREFLLGENRIGVKEELHQQIVPMELANVHTGEYLDYIGSAIQLVKETLQTGKRLDNPTSPS